MGFATDIKSDLERSAVEVFLEYRGRLYADAVKLCNDFTEAEDLVMRTLDAALRDYDNYDVQKGDFYAWLKGILRHNFTRLRLRKVNRVTHPFDPQNIEEMAGSTESTVDEILAHSDHDALRLAISQLDEKYRRAVILHYFSEFSVKEIAGMLRLPIGTVLRRLQIARQLLAAKLSVTLGRAKKPLAVLAAVVLAIGAAFGVTKAVEWARGGDGGGGAPVGAAAVADPAGSCADSVVAQREIDVQISQQKEKTNMKAKQAVAAAFGTAALFGVGAGMEVRADEPVSYTEVEYIETLDNNSWFDTGVKATDAYGIRVKLMPMAQTPEWRSLVSSRLDDFTFGFYNNRNLYYLRRRGVDVTRSGVLLSDEPTVLELESNGQSLGVNSDSIVLFNNAGHNRGSLLRIYECEIFGADGNPILQLQPYVRTQGGIVQHGFCDKLTGLFIANGGTGATKAGPIVMKSDFLSVKGEPVELGEVSPSYGSHSGYSVGQKIVCSAPASWTSGDGRTRATCLGYKVYTNEVVYVEGEGNSFAYVHPDCVAGAELVWQWSREYKVTATAGEGGTVAPEDQWVEEGGSATVEATPADADSILAGWSGDRSGADNPLVLANVRSPLTVAATFGSAISVAQNGSDEGEGTAASPFATIAHALEVAGAQARASSSVVNVKVGPGTFLLDQPLVVGDAIRLVGSGRGITVLDGHANCHPLAIQHAQAFVSDFTIANGKDNNYGGGVYMTAGTLCRCLVTGCTAGFGGGVYLAAGQGPLVSSCIVSNNTATFGGGVYTTTVGTLENSLVCENEASLNGGGVYVSRGTLVRHCTIANNSAETTGGGIYVLSTSAIDKAHDLIVWGNDAPNDADISTGGSNLGYWTNICSTVAVGVSPQTKDPIFRDAANGDYRLAGSSPYRDAAWGVPTSATDVFGNPRVQNGRADIGAIESDPNEKTANMEIESSGHLDKATVTLTAKATNFDINGAVCYWTFDGRTPTAANHDGEGAVVTNVYGVGTCSAALAVVCGGETFVDVKKSFLTIAPSVVHVDLNSAHPAAPYNTRETAAHGLAEALEAADANGGTTILVAPGTYPFAETVTVRKQVCICGEQGADVTVLDGQKKCHPLAIQHAQAFVSDFTIANGKDNNNGGGVYMTAGTLCRCLVTGCTAGYGGGIYLAEGQGALVSCCIVSNNTAVFGGGVYVTAGGTLENSLVCANKATLNGGGVSLNSGALARHCTIANNNAPTGGGIVCRSGSGISAHDLIVWGNTAGDSPDINTANCDISLWTNICSTVAVGVSPQTKDPIFRDAANGDYRLAGSSPYRDAAWGAPTTETDVFGNPRVQNGRMDVGAIESDPNERSANMEIESSGHLDKATVTLTAKATNFDIDDAVCYWTFDGRTPTAADHDGEGAVVTNVYGVGTCSAALAVVCGGETFVDVKKSFLTIAPSVVYVDLNSAHPAAPYNTRETAAHGLAEALEAADANGGTTILVAPGTYPFAETVTVLKQVCIRSEEGPDVTVLDGQAKCHPLAIQHAQAFVSDFTITNGKDNDYGGGVKMTAGTLCRCLVTGNTAGFGGGICLAEGQGALVSCCVVSNNTATFGGGVYAAAVGTLENSLVCENEATLNGGGVSLYRGALARHCTIANNNAPTGGGIVCRSGSGTSAHDLIVWGNTADDSPDITTANCDFSLWTNICSSVRVGEDTSKNNLVADPLFRNAAKGNYRLRLDSPCRNAAWGTPTTAVDLDGNPRIRFRFPDIGCYECQIGPGLMLLVK